MVNINIKIEDDVLKQSIDIFNKFGLTIDDAINLFLNETIKKRCIPFNYLDELTIEAINEGREIAYDNNIKSYKSIEW